MSTVREQTVAWTGTDGIRWKFVFEPDEAGEYWRVEYEQLGETWRQVGREPVENVAIDTSGGETATGNAVSFYRGP